MGSTESKELMKSLFKWSLCLITENRAYQKLFVEKNSELSEKKVKFYNRLGEIEKELKKVSPAPRTVIIG